MKQPIITNIQKYSIHDGKGIRTTVFFKGCPLSCKWCHNPETQRYESEIMTFQERCTGCGICAASCPSKAIQIVNQTAVTDYARCSLCGECTDECLHNARELCGKQMTVDELYKEIEKDFVFYETSNGGVTLSGGEVLAQNMDFIESLMKKLSRNGIRINIDTCGAVPFANIERVIPYTDIFMYDMKLIDEEEHLKYMGMSSKLILDNLKQLSEKNVRIWIRIPIIGGVNDTEEIMSQMADFLEENKIHFDQINLLPYHNTGSGKYSRLQRIYEGQEFKTPDRNKLETLRQVFIKRGFSEVLTD